MSTFTLDAGGGAQAAGQGIGNLVRAFMLGPQVRQQAEADAALRSAQTYNANMSGNKSGAEAVGLGITNEARRAPIATDQPDYMKAAMRLFQNTGDTNALRIAQAGSELQTQGYRDNAASSMDNLDLLNRWNTLAKPGDTYTPMKAVGATGTALNEATGEQIVANEAIRRLFGDKTSSEIRENNAQANSSNASAGKSAAEAELTKAKVDHLGRTGALPGSGAEGGGGALSTNVLVPIRTPVHDERGRVVRNPITGETETQIDPAQLSSFYGWAVTQGAAPTARAFAQWVAEGKPGGNKSPTPTPAAKTITDAPPDKAQRKPGQVYQTPKGPLQWTGTGWRQVN